MTLRALQMGDAQALRTHLRSESGSFCAAPPSTFDTMRRFIRWTQRVRRQGRFLVWGIVPAGQTEPVGIIQIWKVASDFSVAEWGFVIGETYRRRGLSIESARLLVSFAFDTLGVHRLEARVAEPNVRGQALMRKLGATCEARLRQSLKNGNAYDDSMLWALLSKNRTPRARAR